MRTELSVCSAVLATVLFMCSAGTCQEDLIARIPQIEHRALAARQAIKSCEISVSLVREYPGRKDRPALHNELSFLIDGSKVLFKRHYPDANPPTRMTWCRNCFADGYAIHFVDQGNPVATGFKPLASLPRLPVKVEIPDVRLCGMLPDPFGSSPENAPIDSFVGRRDRTNLRAVRDTIDGQECLRISYQYGKGFQVAFWISESQGFSVVRLDWSGPEYKVEMLSTPARTEPAGVWFPKRIVWTNTGGGAVVERDTCTIDVKSINAPIDPSRFEVGALNLPAGSSIEIPPKRETMIWTGTELVPADSPQAATARRTAGSRQSGMRTWLVRGGIILAAAAVIVALELARRRWRRRHASAHGSRSGSALIEVLVVLAIIAVLIGIILPAVQKARAAADRARCTSNLRQLGLALHSYHGAHNAFPPGQSAREQSMPRAAWPLLVLPYVEQEQLWHGAVAAFTQNANPFSDPPHSAASERQRLFVCPSDSRVQQPVVLDRFNPATFSFGPRATGMLSYLGNQGIKRFERDGVLFYASHVRLVEIRDGTSNTLLLGERPPSADLRLGWWYTGIGDDRAGTGDFFLGVRESANRHADGKCRNGPYHFAVGRFDGPCDHLHFWSPHSGGANFAFADGSVRFVAYSADPILPALATREGGETVSPP